MNMLGSDGEKSDKILGVAIGIVTNNKDPDGMGRVKINFPWRDAGDESDWTRIATLMSGKEMGTFFLPEVGDEVLVAFENGDIEHPYILGSLWNGKDKPPETNQDGKNNIRKLKSRSGHEIILNDEKSKEQVLIKTKGGHTILLDDSSGGEKIEIKDQKGSNSVVIDASQIAVKCSMQLHLKANIVEIEADSMMTIKAGATLTLQGALVKIN
jgi:uncharacterized protein involved in type VI secretion and phage assembly